jgi:hypothetical protein
MCSQLPTAKELEIKLQGPPLLFAGKRVFSAKGLDVALTIKKLT